VSPGKKDFRECQTITGAPISQRDKHRADEDTSLLPDWSSGRRVLPVYAVDVDASGAWLLTICDLH
jgi:hypothetical protein